MTRVQDPGFTELKTYVIEATGLEYYRDKDDDLAQRLERRMTTLKLDRCAAYLTLLKSNVDGEFDALVVELTIGETYFFRHEEQFDDLRTTVLPDLIERNASLRRLKIWCAGCSIGAEPYSLAILLREHFAPRLRGWDVRIVATDLNREFLARAERGVFDEWAFRTTGPELRARHFRPAGKSWAIKDEYRAMVEFKPHNLVTPPQSSAALTGEFDLIICRNVMIYFDVPTVKKVTGYFEDALAARGWLIIGHAELAHGARHLELRQLPRVTGYQKAPPTAAAEAPPARASAPIVPKAPTSPLTPPTRADDNAYLRTLANAGELELARACATNLLKRDPTNAVAHYYRGLVQAQSGGDAEADLRRAIALSPDFVMAHYQVALLADARGDATKASRHIRRVLELLAGQPDDAVLPESDDLRAADLRESISRRKGAA